MATFSLRKAKLEKLKLLSLSVTIGPVTISGPEVIVEISCSTKLSTKFSTLIKC